MPTVYETTKLIGDQLVRKKILTQAQLKEAIEKQRLSGRLLGDVLIELGYTTEEEVTEALSEQLDMPFVDVSNYEVDPTILSIFPSEFLREQSVIPLFKMENTYTIAMADPMNIRVIDRLRFICHGEVEPLFGTKTAIRRGLDQYLGSLAQAGPKPQQAAGPSMQRPGSAPSATVAVASPRQAAAAADQVTSLIAAAENAPVVQMVDNIIRQAVDNRASDIHLEPEEKGTFLRYRIDGVLYDVAPPSKQMEAAVISRIKIMAGMDIAERRLPQDGRIQVRYSDTEVDFRVSTFPTLHGENVSIRVLDKSGIMLKLEDLGFEPTLLGRFKELLNLPHGVLLVTGPTGCGKTTTLYSALRTINAVEKNVITLEDPVEYRISRIRQAQVDVKAGLTFANGLRSILRQDPDIILIGEIRDLETSEIAIHAALTGHMVFSTLHTNDAPGALTRLVDMGVEPFLAASSVAAVLAQRLIRKLCRKCREPYPATPEVLKSLGVEDPASGKKITLYRTKGCPECKQTGYRGRTGIYELMETSDPIRELLLKKSSSRALKEQAVAEGMMTLRRAGVHKVLAGVTAVEEVLRVTDSESGG